MTSRQPDGTVTSWTRINWRDTDPLLEVVAWSGGDVTHKTLRYDACLAAASITQDCIDLVLPAELRVTATASVQTPKAETPKAETPKRRRRKRRCQWAGRRRSSRPSSC